MIVIHNKEECKAFGANCISEFSFQFLPSTVEVQAIIQFIDRWEKSFSAWNFEQILQQYQNKNNNTETSSLFKKVFQEKPASVEPNQYYPTGAFISGQPFHLEKIHWHKKKFGIVVCSHVLPPEKVAFGQTFFFRVGLASLHFAMVCFELEVFLLNSQRAKYSWKNHLSLRMKTAKRAKPLWTPFTVLVLHPSRSLEM